MTDSERVDQIKKRLAGNEYFINPHTDLSTREDIEFLLGLLKKKDERLTFLEKKADLLSQQVQELTTEIENVKSDFGGMR